MGKWFSLVTQEHDMSDLIAKFNDPPMQQVPSYISATHANMHAVGRELESCSNTSLESTTLAHMETQNLSAKIIERS